MSMYSKNKRTRRPQDTFISIASTRPDPGLNLPLRELLIFQAIEKEYILKIPQNCKLEKTQTDNKHLHLTPKS